MSKGSIKVQFVPDAMMNSDPKKTVSIHVGGLRIEQDKDDPDLSSYTDDDTTLEGDDRGDNKTTSINDINDESRINNPRMTTELLLILLFSGSGLGLLLVIIILAFLFGLPIAMIAIGAVYLGIESCFDERIAILLIIGGALSILSVFTRTTTKGRGENEHRRRERRERGEGSWTWLRFVHGMITLVDAVWFVVTSFFVYRHWNRVELEDETSQFYCTRTLYIFAFAYLTFCWILCALSFLYILFKFIYEKCACFFKQN